jgi:hypothetical protein
MHDGQHTGRVASCLLQTNSGLRGGSGHAAELAEAYMRADAAELLVLTPHRRTTKALVMCMTRAFALYPPGDSNPEPAD